MKLFHQKHLQYMNTAFPTIHVLVQLLHILISTICPAKSVATRQHFQDKVTTVISSTSTLCMLAVLLIECWKMCVGSHYGFHVWYPNMVVCLVMQLTDSDTCCLISLFDSEMLLNCFTLFHSCYWLPYKIIAILTARSDISYLKTSRAFHNILVELVS